ncbi:general secretion pathway protein L [Luteibacter sp. UNC138MFCol5.1]|uniref:PilN domain-containing protein n=1 Tax=Luteibacter sp. UNC138MFCol5.1 TaxID=1502774 RepID=UPI0008CBE104|nr:type II secretion system protein GspL [Luteibacter sp. UNC138MFCol5.1]SEO99886.1 general secretion pathway protein L [Luteibacter sp. UNC138MFCol5.1]
MTTWQDASQLQLDRLRRAWRGSALPGFLRWWGGELQAFVPVRWRAVFAGGERWYAIERHGDAWRVRRAGEAYAVAEASDGGATEDRAASLARAFADADPSDRRVALVLPPAAVLRRRLVLPLAARDNLRQVVGYDLDRQTPFRAEDIHFGVRELGEGGPEGRFVAELAATPRAGLDPLLDELAALGIQPDRVDVADGNALAGVNLLPPARVPRRVDRRRRLNGVLVAAIVLLAVACMAAWLHNRGVALQAMRDEVEAMRGDAQRVKELRQRLTDSAGASGFLARKKTEAPSILPVLEDLTRRLPDDTWLERFTLNATGQIGFQGQSPQAARLIDALKGASTIGDPSFQGTIQTDPTSGKERFYMQAKAQMPKPEAAGAKTAPATASTSSRAAAEKPVASPAASGTSNGTKEGARANETR